MSFRNAEAMPVGSCCHGFVGGVVPAYHAVPTNYGSLKAFQRHVIHLWRTFQVKSATTIVARMAMFFKGISFWGLSNPVAW